MCTTFAYVFIAICAGKCVEVGGVVGGGGGIRNSNMYKLKSIIISISLDGKAERNEKQIIC